LLGAAAGTAFILGPALGGTLSSTFGYAVPSFLASALALVNLVSAYFRLPEPTRSSDAGKNALSVASLKDILRRKVMALLLATYFLFFVALVFLQSTLSPWVQDTFGWSSFEAGLIFFYLSGVSVFTQAILLPKLTKKFSRSTLVLTCVVALAAGLAALGFLQTLPLLLLVVTVISFGFGGLLVTLNTLISVNAPREAQGGTLGSAWALAALAQTIAPILATLTFAFGSQIGLPGLAFTVACIVAAATIPLVLSFTKYSKTEKRG